MKADNDNLQDPFARLNATWIANPHRRFSTQKEIIEYLVLAGKINPDGDLYNWGETIDALNEFNDSPAATQPLWRLTAQHNDEQPWEAAQRIDRRHQWVYFIDGQEAIKIGTSVSPQSRVKELQTGSWRTLSLIGAMPGGETTEAEIHLLFSEFHIRGEWYERAQPILDFIDCNCERSLAA